jgi:hypothetical protein
MSPPPTAGCALRYVHVSENKEVMDKDKTLFVGYYPLW